MSLSDLTNHIDVLKPITNLDAMLLTGDVIPTWTKTVALAAAATTVLNAAIKGKKHYIRNLQITNGATANSISVLSNTTLLFKVDLPTNNVSNFDFNVPLQCANAEDIKITLSAASAVKINAQGFTL